MRTPIVMIAYNRPDIVRMTMRNVSLAEAVDERDIIMYIDGPRNETDRNRQNEIERIVSGYQKQLPRLKIVRREKNYGCRGNIVSAITEVINRFGRTIVIEDDILISRTFLRYMDEALDFYEDDKRIWAINAYQSPDLKIPKSYKYDVYLNRINMCWGWGTWADRWNAVDFDLTDWPEKRADAAFLAKLEHASSGLRHMIESQYEGRLKTWDVQCSYHMVKNDFFCVEPKYQLSKNIGYVPGELAEHCHGDFPHITRQKYYNFRPKLEKFLVVENSIDRQFADIPVSRNRVVRVWRKLLRGLDYLKPANMKPEEF